MFFGEIGSVLLPSMHVVENKNSYRGTSVPWMNRRMEMTKEIVQMQFVVSGYPHHYPACRQ